MKILTIKHIYILRVIQNYCFINYLLNIQCPHFDDISNLLGFHLNMLLWKKSRQNRFKVVNARVIVVNARDTWFIFDVIIKNYTKQNLLFFDGCWPKVKEIKNIQKIFHIPQYGYWLSLPKCNIKKYTLKNLFHVLRYTFLNKTPTLIWKT